MRLERLTYVHDGDPASMGQLLFEARGQVRFGGEGSGLIEVGENAQSRAGAGGATQEVSLRVASVTYSSLAPDVQREIGEHNVPCILGHSGVKTVVLLPPRSVARITGGVSDLRGKLRYAVARVGWEL